MLLLHKSSDILIPCVRDEFLQPQPIFNKTPEYVIDYYINLIFFFFLKYATDVYLSSVKCNIKLTLSAFCTKESLENIQLYLLKVLNLERHCLTEHLNMLT